MLGRMLAGGAAGYLMTGNMGGAIGGAAFGGAFLGKKGIGTRFLNKRGGVAGLGKSALGAAGRAGPVAQGPSMMKNTSSYFGDIMGSRVDMGAFSKITGGVSKSVGPRRGYGIRANKGIMPMTMGGPGSLTGIKSTGKDSAAFAKNFKASQKKFIEQRGASFEANINKAHGYLGENQVNVNKFGGYALAAMGTMAASRMGSSAISSNRGY